jgi:hypothetical protein
MSVHLHVSSLKLYDRCDEFWYGDMEDGGGATEQFHFGEKEFIIQNDGTDI